MKENSLFIRRRLSEIDRLVDWAIEHSNPNDYGYKDYLNNVCWLVVDEFISQANARQVNELLKYIKDNYEDKVEKYYLSIRNDFTPPYHK